MAVERVLHCDDGLFADWTLPYHEAPSVIEQVPAAAHDGAAGNHIQVLENGKLAYASLENWASAMSLGELRAIGFWWKVLVATAALSTAIIALSIDGAWAVLLRLNPDNEVRVEFTHDGGGVLSEWYSLFTGTEWRHVRLAVIRHATAGGAQLWDGNNLLIDEAKYDATNTYDGTPDYFHAGACAAVTAGFETCQDEFRIATTIPEARQPVGGGRMLMGVGT